MDAEKKLRLSSFALCSLLLLFFSAQVYFSLQEWIPFPKIELATECRQVYVLNLWDLTANFLWILAVGVGAYVAWRPEMYRVLLVAMYFLGPVFLVWTGTALAFFNSFVSCCGEVKDNCVHFSAYLHSDTSYLQLLITLFMSSLLSLYLLCVLCIVIWTYLDEWMRAHIAEARGLLLI